MKKRIVFSFFLISFIIFGCAQEVVQEQSPEQIQQVPNQQDAEEMVVAEDEVNDVQPAEELEPESTTFEIKTPGLIFTPDELTVKKGDKVRFVLGSSHNAVQVDKETWDANKKDPLENGFKVGLGETKELTFDQPGAYYYICQPHASFKMKGVIVVE